jgi:hypothetical protein
VRSENRQVDADPGGKQELLTEDRLIIVSKEEKNRFIGLTPPPILSRNLL